MFPAFRWTPDGGAFESYERPPRARVANQAMTRPGGRTPYGLQVRVGPHGQPSRRRPRLVPVVVRQRHVLDLELAGELRTARKAAGISLRRLERFTGLSRGYLSQLERGLRCPSHATLDKLCQLRYIGEDLERRLRAVAVPTWTALPQ